VKVKVNVSVYGMKGNGRLEDLASLVLNRSPR
jgi:hypothetical protein